ncbi:hypothetical protein A3D85_03020 [Candidatus Amesbacteria bacterium RIFCSPHIGHO2_02_FULL_47_9]|uniref:Uncharacterized protein n=1 Tax=Candidatus Amesbacteria bacterium RIFCSPHIGHO2_01_FULL_48_32b TaxID=1797253 RepID=A0A1F4YGV9_9BACT|nr:MAG: hypothetical protein A2876_04235 [Candidatus Amesbacteria bacterium RIFCSPHIGHO2_01_FULL_48_32b]OGD05064.1 MAG: hypothetical protein A3D85_03020 [Candidatus Amesbacteria bacterium RIFCSPHIGHO2_02_FULL_47_9]OGD08606.1 MAG: hypothetical protein A2899_02505 [Candidatus Amesbacteria bacterium RIFCSPLOWO2_01_FULL_49_25]
MKYKVVGWLDLIFGCLGLVQQIVMLFFIYPKLSSLYQDFGAQLPFLTRVYPYLTAIAAVVLAGVVYIGARLVFGKLPNEKMFKLGVIALAVMFVLGGSYLASSLTSILSPIYGLSSNL